MKKTTVLNLQILKGETFNYAIIPDLSGKRSDLSIDLLKEDYLFALLDRNNMPLVAVFNEDSNEWEAGIEFYKRVNNQFFGKSHDTGKCIYGLSSHSWHKKVKRSEFTLFESEVDFDDLYRICDEDGKYIPEFSTKQNWMHAYHLQKHENVRHSIDYALSQPDTPEF